MMRAKNDTTGGARYNRKITRTNQFGKCAECRNEETGKHSTSANVVYLTQVQLVTIYNTSECNAVIVELQ